MTRPSPLLRLAQKPDGSTTVSVEYVAAEADLPPLLASLMAESVPTRIEIIDATRLPRGLSNAEVLDETLRRLPPDTYRIRQLIARAEIQGWKAPESDSHARTVVRDRLFEVLGERVEKRGSDQKTRWEVLPEDYAHQVEVGADDQTELEALLRSLHREFRGADDYTVETVMDALESAGLDIPRPFVVNRLKARPGVSLRNDPLTGDLCVVWGRP